MVINLTKENFENEVMQSSMTVVVDFWAAWCGPCKMLGPVIEEVSNDYDGKIKVCKVNIDEQPELAARFGVMTIPTCIKFEGGNISAKTVGALPKAALVAQLGL